MSADEYPPLPVLCAPRIPKAGDDRVSGVPTKADAFPTSATHNVVLWANPFMLPCCECRRKHVGIKILAENLGFRVSALFTPSTYPHLKPRHPLPIQPFDPATKALFHRHAATQIGFPGLQHKHSAIHEEGNIHSKGRGCHVAPFSSAGCRLQSTNGSRARRN